METSHAARAPGAEPRAPEPGSAFSKWLLGPLLLAVATTGFGLAAGGHFRPKVGYVSDFTQDWLSAREAVAGRPAYGDLWEALRRHFDGAEPPLDFLRWNAHPPGSILLALPLAYLAHEYAFFAWNLATFPLFVLSVWVVLAELGGGWSWRRAALSAALVATVGITCFPLLQQVVMGQYNALLGFLIALAWAADRRGNGALAGAAIGLAAAIKLFPAFLLLYLLGTRRWRATGAAVGVFLAVNAAALGAFGAGAYRTYLFEAVPEVSARYATRWHNLSLPAFWLRLFGPTPESRIVALAPLPALGKMLAAVSQLAVAAVTLLAAWRATSLAARDGAFALAVTGMVLVSPISWSHYLIMLVMPVGLLAVRLFSSPWRWALVACVLVMWLPDHFAVRLTFGPEFVELLSVQRHPPFSPAQNLLLVSAQHYAVLGLFLLLLRFPTAAPAPSGGTA